MKAWIVRVWNEPHEFRAQRRFALIVYPLAVVVFAYSVLWHVLR